MQVGGPDEEVPEGLHRGEEEGEGREEEQVWKEQEEDGRGLATSPVLPEA